MLNILDIGLKVDILITGVIRMNQSQTRSDSIAYFLKYIHYTVANVSEHEKS